MAARLLCIQQHLPTLASRPYILRSSPLHLSRFPSPPSLPTLVIRRKMATNLQVSEGNDSTVIANEVEKLRANRWELVEGIELKKTYHFKMHSKSVDLFNVIQVESKAEAHHAEIISKFSELTVRWTTHKPRGLSTKDIHMAHFSDEWAKRIGAVASTDAAHCG